VISVLFDCNAINLNEFSLILVGLGYGVLDYGFDDLRKFIFFGSLWIGRMVSCFLMLKLLIIEDLVH
jgi:hypothetical protein